MKAVLRVIFNPVVFWGRMALAGLTLLFLLGVIRMDKFDVTNYAIPEEYLVPMLIASIVVVFLTVVGLRRYLHDKAAETMIEEGTISNAYELAYDWRYDFGSVVGFIFGVAGGIYCAPILVDALFVGAGMWTHVLVAGIAGGIVAIIAITIIHYGIRKWIVKAKEWSEWSKEAAGTVTETVTNAKTAVKTVTKDKQQLP